MGYKLISQIVLVIAAVLIVFTYVRPTFSAIKHTQDETYQYTDAVQKATEYNQKLATLIQKQNSFSAANLQALQTYLPNSVDSMSVVSDLNTIAQMSGIKITEAEKQPLTNTSQNARRKAASGTATSSSPQLKPIEFAVTLHGTYDSFKQFMSLIAKNDYPLVPVDVSVGKFTTAGQQSSVIATNPAADYTLTIRTFTLSH